MTFRSVSSFHNVSNLLSIDPTRWYKFNYFSSENTWDHSVSDNWQWLENPIATANSIFTAKWKCRKPPFIYLCKEMWHYYFLNAMWWANFHRRNESLSNLFIKYHRIFQPSTHSSECFSSNNWLLFAKFFWSLTALK